MQRGSDISVSFANGDRFGAQATASGQVKVYKNSTLLATVDVTAWTYYANGGYIGLWTIGASGTILEDFGGGTIPQGRAPGGTLASLWNEIRSWVGSFAGGGKMAAPVAFKPAVAIRESELTLTNPPAGQIYRNYYFIGSVRVAMREFSGSTNVLSYIVTDHLGSTSMTLDTSGIPVSTMLYKPWGEMRNTNGTVSTDYKFTGQLQVDMGIYYYGSRFYDPYLNRWIQPDSIIPDPYNPLDLDRYSYVRNNPINYNDPTGHDPCTNGSYQSFCPPSNTSERAVFVLQQIVDKGTKTPWEELSKEQKATLTEDGWDQELYNHSDFGGAPELTDIAGTIKDPAVLIALLPFIFRLGPLSQSALAACISLPTCNNLFIGIQPFGEMPYLSGYERHHLIEKRFAQGLGIDPNSIPSVYLTPEEHQAITNAWRQIIGYSGDNNPITTLNTTHDMIVNATKVIYGNYPEFIQAVRLFLSP